MCILMNTEVCETSNLIAMCILVNTGIGAFWWIPFRWKFARLPIWQLCAFWWILKFARLSIWSLCAFSWILVCFWWWNWIWNWIFRGSEIGHLDQKSCRDYNHPPFWSGFPINILCHHVLLSRFDPRCQKKVPLECTERHVGIPQWGIVSSVGPH